jgi:cytochrome c oxidase cbb3-type subunit 3
MRVTIGVIATAALGLCLAAGARVMAQGQGQPPAAPQPQGEHGGQAPPAPQAGPNRQELPRFPAQQRSKADPAVVSRGRGLYSGACSACHGVDARGGQLGGPNLLRSQLVLNDSEGELILPVVQNGRPGTLMVPMAMEPGDVKAIAAFLHDLQSKGSNQGGPPPGSEVALNILVGDAKAGAAYFAGKCARCHSATGDLQGIATRLSDPKTLQNIWVSGGGGRGRGFRAPATSTRAFTTATVTLPSGEAIEGRLVRMDDFLVTLALADGTSRTFRRDGDVPKVDVRDPLAGHRDLLAVYTDKDMHDVTAYLATLK